jgi:hypothetical protein
MERDSPFKVSNHSAISNEPSEGMRAEVLSKPLSKLLPPFIIRKPN